MANGLIAASMLSGFGQGVADAAKTGMQFVGASLLQRERQAMEDRRMQLMEQAAAAREQRGYDFQRGMAQERIGAEMVLKGQERQDANEEKAKERAFTSEEKARDRESNAQIHDDANETTRRGQDITAKHGEDTLDVTRRGQDLTAEHGRDQLAAQKQYYAAVERHYAAMERLAEAKTDSARANANKDLSETAKELANLEKAQGQDFMKMAADATLGEKERSYLIKQAQSHFDRAAMHLGYTGNSAGPGVQIIDRFATPAKGATGGETTTPPAPPPEKPRPDIVVPPTTNPTAPVTAGPTDALSYGFDKLKEGAKSVGGMISDAMMPKPVEAGITRESKEQAIAATKPASDPMSFVQEKRDETAQREANIVKPSNGLIGSAMVGGVPKKSPPPEIQPAVSGDKKTGLDVYNAWSPAEREQASTLMEQVRSGKIDRDTFIAKIISMSDSGTQGLRLAEGMLRNMGME